jgi:predicted DNA-binding protein (UPF0251 family)
MSRPSCCRRVTGHPAASVFTPTGAGPCEAAPVIVALDEFEAIRLADHEGLRQDEAAGEMQISRPTFGRILESAHRKVAAAFVQGRTIRIEGGAVCTLEGCGPRNCPRWNHGGHTSGVRCAASCGRGLAGARTKPGRVPGTPDRQERKENEP